MLTANEARVKQIPFTEKPRVVEELEEINNAINATVNHSYDTRITRGFINIDTRLFLEKLGYDVVFCASQGVWFISWR